MEVECLTSADTWDKPDIVGVHLISPSSVLGRIKSQESVLLVKVDLDFQIGI